MMQVRWSRLISFLSQRVAPNEQRAWGCVGRSGCKPEACHKLAGGVSHRTPVPKQMRPEGSPTRNDSIEPRIDTDETRIERPAKELTDRRTHHGKRFGLLHFIRADACLSEPTLRGGSRRRGAPGDSRHRLIYAIPPGWGFRAHRRSERSGRSGRSGRSHPDCPSLRARSQAPVWECNVFEAPASWIPGNIDDCQRGMPCRLMSSIWLVCRL